MENCPKDKSAEGQWDYREIDADDDSCYSILTLVATVQTEQVAFSGCKFALIADSAYALSRTNGRGSNYIRK